MRILFKTPHQVFFRRCFFVKERTYVKSEYGYVLEVTHGLFGRKKTVIPMEGTVLRLFGLRR